MSKSVLIPIAEGTEEMEAVIIIDMLRRAGISVVVAGDKSLVHCSRNVRIAPDMLIDELSENDIYDAIVLPGGIRGVRNLMENDLLKIVLRKNAARGMIIGAICAAPLILAQFKLIQPGTMLTSHSSIKADLEKFKYSESPVVIDKNIVTSRGPGTAIDFSMVLITIIAGKDKAERIAKDISYYRQKL
ncbi:MAG: hypothetical protein QG635_895 [Bacteroidota bacterium]|nr:hypothetical protein [Bacteroidota bacterium]